MTRKYTIHTDTHDGLPEGLPGGLSLLVTNTARKLPSRVILHAPEKWGKTSWAAQAPTPVFLMSRGETGLETLIDAQQLPPTDHFPEILRWTTMLDYLGELDGKHGFRTLVIDTGNGMARLCEEHITQRDFKGNWDTYNAYGSGIKVALADWIDFLTRLDHLRARHRMSVLMLCHSRIRNFANPEGANYDRYAVDMPELFWGQAHKWADVILFGKFVTVTEAERKGQKAKAHGGQDRLICSDRTAAYDAGNRLGLPALIDAGSSPREAWDNFMAAAKKEQS